jgi:hypothetical protein
MDAISGTASSFHIYRRGATAGSVRTEIGTDRKIKHRSRIRST